MWGGAQVVRSRRGVALTLLLAAALLPTGCARPGATRVEAFVTRDDKVVLTESTVPQGETILHLENDDTEAHVVVLARITDRSLPTDGLPLVQGRVPTGRDAEQRWTGEGYEVVAKSERLKAYFNGPHRVRTLFHVHLRPGRYVLFANRQGDYARGILAELTVTS